MPTEKSDVMKGAPPEDALIFSPGGEVMVRHPPPPLPEEEGATVEFRVV